MPHLWRSTVQNRNYFNNSSGLEVDASGLAVVPALVTRLPMSPVRLPLERWDTFMPNRPVFSIDAFTNIFKNNGPTGNGPDRL